MRPAAEVYAKEEGPPGKDSGPYIFFGMFARYIEVLLAMRGGTVRDHLLARALGFSEQMLLSADPDLRDLAYIELYENQDSWWYGRAYRFLGPAARAELDRCDPHWKDVAQLNAEADLERDIIDVYGVRDVVLRELRSEGYGVWDVPGITAPRSWQRMACLEEARKEGDAVAFLSCYGTSHPYVICPISEICCAEQVLFKIAGDLADIHNLEANQREKVQVAYFHIQLGERVWKMQIGGTEHSRYSGKLWIAEEFVKRGLVSSIEATLSNVRQ